MPADDLIFSNVTVLDGTGGPGRTADVTVSGDRITHVAEPGSATEAASVIDGTGLTLAPGFIDVHTHDDSAVLYHPEHACKTLQGVTSVVVGNCGISAAPKSEHTPGMTEFERMADYFDALDAASPAVNVAALVGHGAIRGAVIGLREDRLATPGELSAMADHVAQAMDDGAIGLSTGLAYEPGRYAPSSEVAELCRIVADAGGIYATHMRDEGDHLLASIDESIGVAEETGVPLQISHLKAAGRNNWGTAIEALARIDAARGRGVDVMADQYPYTRGSSLLEQIVNGGALDGPSPFGHVSTDQILVAAAPDHRDWEGRTITDIASDDGVEPREMADRIIEAEGRACIVVIDMMSEDDVRAVMAHDAVMTGSDGVPFGEKPHPRLHHTYPRVLGHYARDEGVFGLPEAVRRMTSMPADRFGFTDRGVIRPGAFADLVLFDAATIVDTGTYTDPTTVPDGIVGVWVNGEAVVENGGITGARPGHTVRRGA